MKCENCGKNEVTFVYRSNVNGKVTEAHLCSDCAEKLGYTQKLAAGGRSMMEGFFGDDFFGNFFSPMPSLLGRMNRMLEDPFDDFFAEMPALSAHPAETKPVEEHKDDLVGKEEQSRFARMRERNALRQEMKKAIASENFERAAELRDKLHELDGPQSK